MEIIGYCYHSIDTINITWLVVTSRPNLITLTYLTPERMIPHVVVIDVVVDDVVVVVVDVVVTLFDLNLISTNLSRP